MNKLVSIIVPCYNQAQYLDEALQSVLNQAYFNWECIIVNDGSTDETEIIANKWCNKDDRFKYYYKENGGLSSARNFGLDKSKGNFIQFLDADDFIHKDKLKYSIDLIKNKTIEEKQIVITGYQVYFDSLKTFSKDICFKPELLNYTSVLYGWDDLINIPIHCGFFDASLFVRFRFPEKIKAKEDWIMWVEILRKTTGMIAINKPLAFYRKHNESMTMQNDILQEYLKAIRYLKNIISKEEYEKLTINLFSNYYNKSILLKAELEKIKNSDSFRFMKFIKSKLIKFHIIKPVKYFLKIVLKLKRQL